MTLINDENRQKVKTMFGNRKHSIVTVVAILSVIILISMAFAPADVSGESESATDISGFDDISSSGCTNDAAIYNSASNGIKLDSGWGEFSLASFPTLDMDFYLQIEDIQDEGILWITDSADTTNYVKLEFLCYSSGETKVSVTDTYLGDTNTGDNREHVDILDDWAQVDVIIARSDSDYDGSSTILNVDVGSEDLLIDWVLRDAEISTTKSVRNFDTIKFESESDSDEIHLDDIEIDTGGDASDWTLTWLIGGLIIAYVVLAGIVGFWPFNGNLKKPWTRGKIIGKR